MLIEIIDENYKKQIIFLLNNNWTGFSDYHFPVQNSINIENRYIYKLKTYDYFVYKKDTEDKKRAILFLFLNSEGSQTAVIILKDFTIYKINIECIEEYYLCTIFDISYHEDNITIYDTFMLSGNKINRSSFIDRIYEGSCFIHNISHTDIPIDIVEYTKDISIFKDKMKKSDELFFIPNFLPIVTGINYSSFKWKPCELITFSLQTKESEENLELYTTNFKILKIFAKIHNTDEKGKEYIDYIKNLENYNDECILDINILDNKIHVVGVNTVKTIPNTLRSIEKILLIKNENISLDTLIDCFR